MDTHHAKPASRLLPSLLVPVLLVIGSLLAQSRALPSLEQALSALKAKDVTKALQLLDEIKRKDPENPLPYAYSAQALLQDARPYDAASEIAVMPPPRKLTGPQTVDVARVLSQVDRKQAAAEILSDASERKDFPAEGFWMLSQLLQDLKKVRESISALKSYAFRAPADPRILLREAKLQMLAGDLEPALTTLEKVVELHPDAPEGYYEMARTLRFGNNPEAAKRIISEAIKRKGKAPDYFHLQGLIATDLGDFEAAVSALEQASRLEGAPSRVFFDLGNAYRRLGDRESSQRALAHYEELFQAEQARKNRAESVLQLVNQGSQQLQTGDAGAARASFLRALELDPQNYPARASLIQIYLSSGTLGQAREELKQLQEQSPRSAEVSFLAAYLNYQEQNLAEAEKEAETSRLLRPGNPELRNLLGNIYFALGKEHQALNEYQAATELAPDELAYQANYRTLARRLGEP